MAQSTLTTSPNAVQQEIEEVVHIAIYPGTEVMTDSKSQAFQRSNQRVSKSCTNLTISSWQSTLQALRGQCVGSPTFE